MDELFGAAFIIILAGIALLLLTQQRRTALSLPTGKLIYQDAPDRRGEMLFSQTMKLSGRPDALVREGSMIIPVELKTGRTPKAPYAGHIMQLAAYCHLVEQKYNVRPTHGIIRYDEGEFSIEYTADLEWKLEQLVQEMHLQRDQNEIHRDHNHKSKCDACSFWNNCSERL